MEEKTFAKRLINWYTERKRDLPWRRTKDPYPVWLSEIILQQTRVDQGLPYWERFMESFPTIHDLAKAPEEKVLRLWQGLGYYSRARNLHTTAKHISEDLGHFPETYDEILKLKGVGPYTAAAIASICFNEPKPVVDGNVFRFAARYFGIKEDISKSGTRKIFEKQLDSIIPDRDPGSFNQAMMEFGATICSPKAHCEECPFRSDCFAAINSIQKQLPVKTGKTKVRDRYFNYLVFRIEDNFLLNERTAKDVWSGLFDFYLIEGTLSEEELLEEAQNRLSISSMIIHEITEPVIHILSHQKIHARFFDIEVNKTKQIIQKSNLESYSVEEMLNLPKPKLIVNYLQRVGIK